MRFASRRPSPRLAHAVDYLWSLTDAPAHAHERIVPSGTVELVINVAEDEFRIYAADQLEKRLPGAIVSGCYGRAFDIDTREHASVIGVHFRPGGAGVLGLPAGELADTHVSLEQLWGRAATELRERVCAARPADRFALVEQFLLARTAHDERPIVTAARVALDQPGIEVGEVARELQVSRRHLIELFRADVGMAPKLYARVRRFQRALARAAATQDAWAQIALACGYYDQSHLCREWAELTGLTPREVMRLRQVDVKDNHVALVKSVQDEAPGAA